MSLVIDSKEHGLIRALAAGRVAHEVKSLPVGDVLCTYEHGGCSWVMERKRADDLASSIKDGRWREQASRLFGSGLKVFFVVEGDLRGICGMYESMLGAVVNANLRSSCAWRTWDVEETARLVAHLVAKMETLPKPIVEGGLQPPKSKRKRCSENVFQLQLRCIPSISEAIADTLAERFSDIESLQDALRDVKTFPRIRVSARAYLGKARIAKLRAHLLKQC